MNNKLLTIRDLTIGFQNKIILQNVNADLLSNTVVTLMGENGIGKSCLLYTIAKLLPLHKGSIVILDKELAEFTVRELAQTIAFVLTEKVQVDFLKVCDLVAMGRSPYLNSRGSMTKNDWDVVFDVMALMNITSLQDFFFSDLSDGQKQKVMIARALAQDPKILILDEPTTHLDIPSKIELMKILNGISRKKNMAILLSSHDAELVSQYSDSIWYINGQGQLSSELPSNASQLFSKSERGLVQ